MNDIDPRNQIVKPANWLNFKRWWVQECHERDPESIEFYEHSPIVTAATAASDAVIVTIDMKAMRYSYVSPNFDDFTGWKKSDYDLKSVEYVYSTMLPADREGLVFFSELINEHFRKLPDDKRKKYKFIWDQHISSEKFGYFRILQQCSVLRYDGDTMEILLSFATKLNKLQDGIQHLRLVDGVNDLFYKYDHKTKRVTELKLLSEREKEIAKLVARSFTLKEAATALNISFNTVKNHSANMMEKLEVTNTVEMLNLLTTWGYI